MGWCGTSECRVELENACGVQEWVENAGWGSKMGWWNFRTQGGVREWVMGLENVCGVREWVVGFKNR